MSSQQEHLMKLVVDKWTQKDTQDILKFIKYLYKQCLIDENSEDQIAISIVKERIGPQAESQRTLWISIREVVNIPQEDYIKLRSQILQNRASYMEHVESLYTEWMLFMDLGVGNANSSSMYHINPSKALLPWTGTSTSLIVLSFTSRPQGSILRGVFLLRQQFLTADVLLTGNADLFSFIHYDCACGFFTFHFNCQYCTSNQNIIALNS